LLSWRTYSGGSGVLPELVAAPGVGKTMPRSLKIFSVLNITNPRDRQIVGLPKAQFGRVSPGPDRIAIFARAPPLSVIFPRIDSTGLSARFDGQIRTDRTILIFGGGKISRSTGSGHNKIRQPPGANLATSGGARHGTRPWLLCFLISRVKRQGVCFFRYSSKIDVKPKSVLVIPSRKLLPGV